MTTVPPSPFVVEIDPESVRVNSVRLYGVELLDQSHPAGPELIVNGLPLKTRSFPVAEKDGRSEEHWMRLKGERFTDHLSGWGLVVTRSMGVRQYAKWPCFGVHYHIRRELCDMTDLPSSGPGGPVIEAPLFVDTFGLLNWNWKFWGDDTRMVFPSLHSNGPADEYSHIGYEHDTPETCKHYMQNVRRRLYPGTMAIHGGLFYNAKTGHWIAITCRRPNVGYIVNIENAGRGVGYDFTLHAPFGIGDSLQMPEVKIYYGDNIEQMWRWAADYIGFYYEEPPEWVHRTVWMDGLAWSNEPTWTQQAEAWEKRLDSGIGNGIGYSLVTNRPVKSGTTPLGYEPDPNHGTIAEFRAMGRRIADRGAPYLVWMSHSGLCANSPDVDDDWFIRGIDGRMSASWGSIDGGMIHINPGHPGYIEYTKKWIRFYMRECGAKGIFLDCLGWAFPPDYKPRSFMRYPGDTNRMAIRFMEECYACIKECDPDGIMLGEGTTLDAPVNIFSIAANPRRAIDGLGPRDFYLQLHNHGGKRFVVDQGPRMFAASGMIGIDNREGSADVNRRLTTLVAESGGRDAFIALPGDLSIMPDHNLLIVPTPGEVTEWSTQDKLDGIALPMPWQSTQMLVDTVTGGRFSATADGRFVSIPAGIYEMKSSGN
ncbi:MAG TPA: hypothetical protein VGK19_10520 [Capsulimonadaceae bacterium]